MPHQPHQLNIEAFDYTNAGQPVSPQAPYIRITDPQAGFGTGPLVDMAPAGGKDRIRLKHRKAKTADDSHLPLLKKRKPQPLARLVKIPKPQPGASAKGIVIDRSQNDSKGRPMLEVSVDAAGKLTATKPKPKHPANKVPRASLRTFYLDKQKTIVRSVLYIQGQTRVCFVLG